MVVLGGQLMEFTKVTSPPVELLGGVHCCSQNETVIRKIKCTYPKQMYAMILTIIYLSLSSIVIIFNDDIILENIVERFSESEVTIIF